MVETKIQNPTFSTRLSKRLVKLMKLHCVREGLKVQEFIAECIEKGLKGS